MSNYLVDFGIRFAIFAAVFALGCWRLRGVQVRPRWALPLVAVTFATLNTALYGVMVPLVNLASLWTLSLVAPLIANGAFVYLTARVLRPLRIDGVMPMLWLSLYLTAAHFGLGIIL
jgi:hypothetical protein